MAAVQDWSKVDYYALLGVEPNASAEAIAQAFRAAAKQSHPDATGDPAAADRFAEIIEAYKVLSEPRRRRDYDRVRSVALTPVTTSPVPRRVVESPSWRPSRWSRRRAWWILAAGIVVALLGAGTVALTWRLHDQDASRRAQTVPIVARRLDDGFIRFILPGNRVVIAEEPQQHGEGTGTGPTIKVRYNPSNPKDVIVDANSVGRDITLGVVALKLLVGGVVFSGLALRRLSATGVR